jgi:AraC-like DNA-binding protein
MNVPESSSLFRSESQAKFSAPDLFSQDQPFLLRVAEIVETHLGDCELCSGNLHRLVPTSRATLHRLLHKYTGLCASDYLNRYRVIRSLDHLSCCFRSISEVADCVGMTNSAYTRAFKQVFGQTPTEYRRLGDNALHIETIGKTLRQ